MEYPELEGMQRLIPGGVNPCKTSPVQFSAIFVLCPGQQLCSFTAGRRKSSSGKEFPGKMLFVLCLLVQGVRLCPWDKGQGL